MATWTIHARDDDLAAAIAGDRLKVIREGFSWSAFLVPFAWAPWNRLWLVFLGWLAAVVAIQAVDVKVDAVAGGALSAAFTLWFALAARDLQRWTLERNGWRLVGLVEADDVAQAEARFAEKLAAHPAPALPVSPWGLAPAAIGGTP